MSKKSELKEKANGGDAQAQYELAVLYNDAFFAQRKKAVQLWTAAAEQNHTLSQYRLGEAYRLGKGAKQNSATALSWYEKAAAAGNVESHYKAGMMYRYGSGGTVELDLKKAVAHWTAAAEKGHAKAQCELGRCYYDGVGVELDYKIAIDWYNKALAKNEPQAMIALGDCSRYGRGVALDTEQAIRRYTQAGNAGCSDGWVALGDLYIGLHRDGFDIIDTVQDIWDQRSNGKYVNENKAYKFYKKAANRGNDRGQTMVYCFQFYHSKALPPKQEDKRDGFLGIERLAKSGCPEAQYLLGMIYERGDKRGVFQINQNVKSAKELLLKACKQGNCGAMWRFALLTNDQNTRTYWLQRGADFGNAACASMVTANIKPASELDFHYTRLAYERGAGLINTGVPLYLAWLYLKGAGTTKDVQKARELYYSLSKDYRSRKANEFETELRDLQAFFGRG